MAAGALLLAAADLAAGPETFGVRPPHGWIGTTDEWIRGLGVLLALLNLGLLLAVWRSLRTHGVDRFSKSLLFGAVLLVPTFVVFLATAHGMSESQKPEACGECHVMKGHLGDMRDPKSDSLAAAHFKNRYILENQCYTCHTDYGMNGTIRGKLDGLRHSYLNLTGDYPKPIKIAAPYQNVRCLGCHGGAANYVAKHDEDILRQMAIDEASCLDCHGPAHTPEEESGRQALLR